MKQASHHSKELQSLKQHRYASIWSTVVSSVPPDSWDWSKLNYGLMLSNRDETRMVPRQYWSCPGLQSKPKAAAKPGIPWTSSIPGCRSLQDVNPTTICSDVLKLYLVKLLCQTWHGSSNSTLINQNVDKERLYASTYHLYCSIQTRWNQREGSYLWQWRAQNNAIRVSPPPPRDKFYLQPHLIWHP